MLYNSSKFLYLWTVVIKWNKTKLLNKLTKSRKRKMRYNKQKKQKFFFRNRKKELLMKILNTTIPFRYYVNTALFCKLNFKNDILSSKLSLIYKLKKYLKFINYRKICLLNWNFTHYHDTQILISLISHLLIPHTKNKYQLKSEIRYNINYYQFRFILEEDKETIIKPVRYKKIWSHLKKTEKLVFYIRDKGKIFRNIFNKKKIDLKHKPTWVETKNVKSLDLNEIRVNDIKLDLFREVISYFKFEESEDTDFEQICINKFENKVNNIIPNAKKTFTSNKLILKNILAKKIIKLHRFKKLKRVARKFRFKNLKIIKYLNFYLNKSKVFLSFKKYISYFNFAVYNLENYTHLNNVKQLQIDSMSKMYKIHLQKLKKKKKFSHKKYFLYKIFIFKKVTFNKWINFSKKKQQRIKEIDTKKKRYMIAKNFLINYNFKRTWRRLKQNIPNKSIYLITNTLTNIYKQTPTTLIFNNSFLSKYFLKQSIFNYHNKTKETIINTKYKKKKLTNVIYSFNFWKKKLKVYKEARKIHWNLFTNKTIKARRYKNFLQPFLKKRVLLNELLLDYFSVKFKFSASFWYSFTELYLLYFSKKIEIKSIYQFPISYLFWSYIKYHQSKKNKIQLRINSWIIKAKKIEQTFWMNIGENLPHFFFKQTFFTKNNFSSIQFDFKTNYICILKNIKYFKNKNQIIYSNKMLKLHNMRYKA